jgi:hypothetical protein
MSIKDNLVTGALVVGTIALGAGVSFLTGKLIDKGFDALAFKAQLKRVDEAIAKVTDKPNFTRSDLTVALFAAKVGARLHMTPAAFERFEGIVDFKVEEAIRAHYSKFVVTPVSQAK